MNSRRFRRLLLLAVSAAILVLPCFTGCSSTTTPPEAIQINGFNILMYEPETRFPDYINFSIDVESDSEISRISLQYQVEKLTAIPVTSVVFPEFEPGTSVEASWEWQMRRTGGLPPGTKLTYWWTVDDADGSSADTPSRSLSFDDRRFSWKSKKETDMTLLWYEGRDSFAEDLLMAAQQATERLESEVGAALTMPAEIYIYSSYEDLRGAMVFPQEWTGGAAYPDYGTIAIGIPLTALDWGKGAISHEIAHLVVHQEIFSGYGVDLPTWLDEGLAMYSEGGLSPDFSTRLQNAIDQDRVFTVRSLSSSFPADEESARLAYAQSYSLVSFLLEEHGGKEKMIQLLEAFRAGSGYIEALNTVYGLDIDELNSQWREHVGLAST